MRTVMRAWKAWSETSREVDVVWGGGVVSLTRRNAGKLRLVTIGRIP